MYVDILHVCVWVHVGDSEEVQGIGSVSGGGRYDELVNMFQPSLHMNILFCTCVNSSSHTLCLFPLDSMCWGWFWN